MNKNHIKQITLAEARECIQRLKRINLNMASVDEIKKMIKPLWVGYSLKCPILRPDNIFYRGVKWEIKPTQINQLTYPSCELIKNDQRANRAGTSRFYASNSRSATFFELGMLTGEFVVVSTWRVKESMLVNNVGYTKEVFTDYQSKRDVTNLNWGSPDSKRTSPLNNIIHSFFAREFSKVVIKDSEYLYKISIAIAEGLFGESMNVSGDLSGIQNPPKDRRLCGLLYPTLAMLANTDNLVLLPEFADKYLEFKCAEYIRVDKVYPDHKYDITIIDFADSLSEDGLIKWKGRHPQWVLDSSNSTLKLSVEDGRWVARNEKGKIIDPS